MLWSFMAVFFSGWLHIDASYRGPRWQRWLFKFITLILLLVLAWQAPNITTTGYLIILGLLATIGGSGLMILSSKRLLYVIGAFFLSHMLYTIGFINHMTLTVFWMLPVTLLIIGTTLIIALWSRLNELRWPVCVYIGITLLMVWITGERYFLLSNDYTLSLLIGTTLLLVATGSWLINHYCCPINIARAVTSTCYFTGHFFIVRSLYL